MRTAAYQGGCACPLALFILWVFVLLPAPAQGQPAPPSAQADSEFQLRMSTAARLYQELEYERALEQLKRARALARGVDQDVTIELYEGIILADMGRREEALAAFKTALLLKPTAQLPVRVSPKVAADFEAVRQEVLRIQQQEAQRAQPRPAPPEDAPVRPPEKPAPVVKVEPPPSQPLVPERLEQRSRPVPVLPLTLLGTGVVAGGLGGYFGLQSRSQVRTAREAEFYDVRAQHLDDARKQARVANLLFVVASAAATGAVITNFTRADEPHPAGKTPRSALLSSC